LQGPLEISHRGVAVGSSSSSAARSRSRSGGYDDLVGVDAVEQVVAGVRRRRAAASVQSGHGAARHRHAGPQRCGLREVELGAQPAVTGDRAGELVAELVPRDRRRVCITDTHTQPV